MTHVRFGRGPRAATLSVAGAAIVAAGLVGSLGSSSGAAPAAPVAAASASPAEADEVGWDPAMPVWVRASEQRRICQLAAAMPSHWAATAVMQRHAEQPLAGAAERDRWRRDAELLPSSWPAAEAMLAAAEARLDCTWWVD